MSGFSRRNFLLAWLSSLLAGLLGKPASAQPAPIQPLPLIPVFEPAAPGPLMATGLTTTLVYDAMGGGPTRLHHSDGLGLVGTFTYDGTGFQKPSDGD